MKIFLVPSLVLDTPGDSESIIYRSIFTSCQTSFLRYESESLEKPLGQGRDFINGKEMV